MIGPYFSTILDEARSGSQGAFVAIYNEFAPGVRGLARSKGIQDADDIVTETMASVAGGLRRFEGAESTFRGWVFKIAYRRIADDYRRRSARITTTPLPDSYGDSMAASAEHVALRETLSPEVSIALSALSSDQREVLLLRVLGELSLAEVAKVLGKKLGAVKMLQSRAIRAMAMNLEANVAFGASFDDGSR